jgi:GNAT superfamily N-acetyltransferase
LTNKEISDEEVVNRLKFVEESTIDQLFVAVVEGKVVGLLGFRLRENIEEVSRYGEISLIVADSNKRRSGIGKALMEFAERIAVEKSCKGTWLVSGFGRTEEAHKFYQSMGFEITGYRFVKKFDE